ncbi:hypothetical protein [Pedobacter sp. Leaf41]|uniref:hypothetical protein n=1 Tax=Pedobacter sp. Leaf41 TaxID=1736218 RepID=UPI0012FBCEF8|nr:hypothetical protein [Pedobacter sp. Leaf41]
MDNLNFYRYENEKNLLVVNKNGKIKRLYCPFPVSDGMRKISAVTAIASGNDEKIYYKINGTYYEYSSFVILGK